MSERAFILTDETGKTTTYGSLKILVRDITDERKYYSIRRGVKKAAAGELETPYFEYEGYKIQESEVKRAKKKWSYCLVWMLTVRWYEM